MTQTPDPTPRDPWVEIELTLDCIHISLPDRWLLQDAVSYARAATETRYQQEIADLKRRVATERCEKCGTLVPPKMIAVEIKDGAPIDDPAGFMWCIVCHSQRVLAQKDETIRQLQDWQARTMATATEVGQMLGQLEQQIASLTQERDEARDNLHYTSGCCDLAMQHRDAAEAQVRTLRTALEPFAALAAYYDPPEDDNYEIAWDHKPTLGQLRAARAALTGEGQPT